MAAVAVPAAVVALEQQLVIPAPTSSFFDHDDEIMIKKPVAKVVASPSAILPDLPDEDDLDETDHRPYAEAKGLVKFMPEVEKIEEAEEPAKSVSSHHPEITIEEVSEYIQPIAADDYYSKEIDTLPDIILSSPGAGDDNLRVKTENVLMNLLRKVKSATDLVSLSFTPAHHHHHLTHTPNRPSTGLAFSSIHIRSVSAGSAESDNHDPVATDDIMVNKWPWMRRSPVRIRS